MEKIPDLINRTPSLGFRWTPADEVAMLIAKSSAARFMAGYGQLPETPDDKDRPEHEEPTNPQQ